jgi:hypothetical protein
MTARRIQSNASDEAKSVTLTVVNTKTSEVSFVLEPWGEVYPLSAGDEVRMIFRGPSSLAPEVEVSESEITVCGSPGSTVRVFQNDEELGSGLFERTPVPGFSPDQLPYESPDGIPLVGFET